MGNSRIRMVAAVGLALEWQLLGRPVGGNSTHESQYSCLGMYHQPMTIGSSSLM